MLLEGQPSHQPAVFHISNSFQRESSEIEDKDETWETTLHDDLEVGSWIYHVVHVLSLLSFVTWRLDIPHVHVV